MAIHQMNLQLAYFNFIKNGTKRIELRLYDEKRKRIELSNIIEFTSTGGDRLNTRVIGILRYRSFRELVEDFDISMLADAAMTKMELLDKLNEIYPVEKQKEFGVVGIRLELLS